jgi:hypothetical protein
MLTPMNQLSAPKRVQVISALMEGASINSTVRNQSLKISPAMAAGPSTRLWEIGDLVALLR